MSSSQAINAFDLLGQAELPSRFARLPGAQEPQLHVGWGEFRQSLFSSLGILVGGPTAPRNFLSGGFFKDCWVERRIPRRPVIAALLWHVAFLTLPFPELPAAPRHYSAFDNTQLVWSGPINDLPLVNMRAEKPKPSPRGEPDKPVPAPGADAFHPRQRIFTDPVRPTHPRQTLINSAAPPEPPKILPTLPNMVQLAPTPAPTRPRLEISQKTLAQLRPRLRRRATVTEAPAPDIPTSEQKPGEIALAATTNAPARPKLELNAGAAPRQAERRQTGDVGTAPELAQAPSAANGSSATFIALSATPGPAAPAQLPEGNLSARVSISPEGKQSGVPGGNPGNSPSTSGGTGGDSQSRGGSSGGIGRNSTGVSISGGNPPPNAAISGLGGRGRIATPSSRLTIPRSEPVDDPPVRTDPPNFAALPPGAKPEAIFSGKRVYTLNVNMPNLNSATGSWILNFSELRTGQDVPRIISGDLAAPSPLRKVDPKYPPTLINEHVEGEVVLYAVIRKDGTVDSIQLVHGIDETLDGNAMQALSQWRFRPAEKAGETVDLEAIVHIPFHAPSDR